ncbi:MAG: response regulator transcription factor [Dehalococcoidia bacterium]
MVDSISGVIKAGVRQTLSSFSDIEIVADCDPSEDVVDLIEDASPNVVVVDINLPSLTGVALARRIARNFPSIKVITLTSYPGEEQLFEALKAGATAYLHKNVSPEELAETIEKVYKEEYPIDEYLLKDPDLARKVLKQFQELSVIEEEILFSPLPP